MTDSGFTLSQLDALERPTERRFHYDLPRVCPEGTKEDDVQAAMLRDLKACAPEISAFAVPNAGKRTRYERQQRKREGMKAGVVDLILTWPRGVAFVEVKAKATDSQAQREFLNARVDEGHHAGVFRSSATLLQWLRECGAPVAGRVQ